MERSEREFRERRRQMMLEGNLLRVIPLVAFPQVVTMLIDSLYNMADTYFVSRLGYAATAAVGINDSMMLMFRALAMMFGTGASSYISRLLGAKRDEDASRAASTTLGSGMAFTAVVAAAVLGFLSPFVDFLGANESTRAHAMDYARWILIFTPFSAGSVCLSQMLRSEGSTTFSMIGLVSGCFLNVFLDPIFITALGFGVSGAAIATGISQVLSFVILLIPYFARRCVLRLSPRLFTPKAALFSEIAKMGIPAALRMGMMSVSSIVINNVAGSFGEIVQAAVTVANKCMRVVSAAVLGFGQGLQPIVGYCWGAGRYGRVRKAFLYTSGIGLSISVVLGIALGVFAEQAIRLFTDETSMMGLGITLIRSQSAVLPPHVWVIIVTGFFQGMGKPIQSAVLGLSRQVFSLIPCVLILTSLFGVTGLTYAQAAADVVSFLIALAMVVPMMRTLNRMTEREEASADAVPQGDAV